MELSVKYKQRWDNSLEDNPHRSFLVVKVENNFVQCSSPPNWPTTSRLVLQYPCSFKTSAWFPLFLTDFRIPSCRNNSWATKFYTLIWDDPNYVGNLYRGGTLWRESSGSLEISTINYQDGGGGSAVKYTYNMNIIKFINIAKNEKTHQRRKELNMMPAAAGCYPSRVILFTMHPLTPFYSDLTRA